MRIFLIALLLSFLFSCQKEKFNSSNLVGKWEFRYFTSLNDNNSINIPNYSWLETYGYNSSSYGKLVLEITDNNELLFKSDKGVERLKIVSSKELNYQINVFEDLNPPFIEVHSENVSGYALVLKNWKGQKFEFKIVLDNYTGSLITVPWQKNNVFYDSKAPFSGNNCIKVLGECLTSLPDNLGGPSWNINDHYSEQTLGIFKMIQ